MELHLTRKSKKCENSKKILANFRIAKYKSVKPIGELMNKWTSNGKKLPQVFQLCIVLEKLAKLNSNKNFYSVGYLQY